MSAVEPLSFDVLLAWSVGREHVPADVVKAGHAFIAAHPPSERRGNPVRSVWGWTDFRQEAVRIAVTVDLTRSRALREQLAAAGFERGEKRSIHDWPHISGPFWIWVSPPIEAERIAPESPDGGNVVPLARHRGRQTTPSATRAEVDIDGGAVVVKFTGARGETPHRLDLDEALQLAQRIFGALDAIRREVDERRRSAERAARANKGASPVEPPREVQRPALRIVPPA